SDCRVDALEIAGAARAGIEMLAVERLRALVGLFAGDLVEGLEIERCPELEAWLVAQRRRFRACHVAVLEHLVGRVSGDEAFLHLDAWLRLAPFDRRAHETLLGALARDGRLRDGEEHLAATIRLFEAEGLDPAPLRAAWRAARTQVGGSAQIRAANV